MIWLKDFVQSISLILRKCGLVLFAFLFSVALEAQDRSGEWSFLVDTRIIASENLPFWLSNQRDGRFSNHAGANFLFAADREWSLGKINVTSKAEVVLDGSQFFPKELGVVADFKQWTLGVGQFPEVVGEQDHILGSGSMITSRNARPRPGIYISSGDFRPVFPSFPWFGFRGSFSNQWLERNDRFVEKAKIHAKAFYISIEIFDLRLIGGLVHGAMWGGFHPTIGKMEEGFDGLWNAILPLSDSAKDRLENFDAQNRRGNHVFGYDYGIQFHNETIDTKISRLFYVEDTPGLIYRNPWDGMWQFSLDYFLENESVISFVYDHVNTTRQSSYPEEPKGADNYYNHFIYEDGWTFQNLSLGNSFLIGGSNGGIIDNIVLSHHIGLGYRDEVQNIVIKTSYVRSYGIVFDQTPQGWDIVNIDGVDQIRPIGILLTLDDVRRVTQRSLISYSRRLNDPNLEIIANLGFDDFQFERLEAGLELGVRFHFQ